MRSVRARVVETTRQCVQVRKLHAYAIRHCRVTIQSMTIKIAHFSDSHIGYEAYKSLAVSGENQRSVDIVKSFVNIVSDIIESDPPLVVHSGDLADRTVIPIRLILMIRAQLMKLAALRKDGSRRQVVLIAGNHEIPRSHKEACFLHLFDGLPGVHVVTNKYTQIEFTDVNVPKELENVVVHALPHDVLKTVDFETVVPRENKYNILLAHGVAGGSDLYVRSLGREFAIPTTVLARSWDYGALGHWHKQGPITVLNSKNSKETDFRTSNSRIWYAGSGENMGFGDLRENGLERGWLHVTLDPNREVVVTRKNIPIRHMVKLEQIDGAGLSVEDLEQKILLNINSSSIQGSVVSQVVVNVPRDTWSLVNLTKIRACASTALHYEVVSKPHKSSTEKASSTKNSLGDIDKLLEECALEILSEHERAAGVDLARFLLNAQIETAGLSLFESTENAASTPSDLSTETITEQISNIEVSCD